MVRRISSHRQDPGSIPGSAKSRLGPVSDAGVPTGYARNTNTEDENFVLVDGSERFSGLPTDVSEAAKEVG